MWIEGLSIFGGLLGGGVISGLWMRWALSTKYKEMEKMRAVLFQQLLYEYDKKIEIEELIEEIDEWLEENNPEEIFKLRKNKED